MVDFLDKLKKLGFDYATSSGISISPWELGTIVDKEKLLTQAEAKINQADSYYSQARASSENLTQIFAMRGHTTNYLGEVIETPITSSLWEGLSPLEFFISVYGAIKGMIDLALKTAEAGYLTRRLVESSQNITITSSDCQTQAGALREENIELPLTKQVYGRYLADDIANKKKEIILTRNTLLLEKEIKIIQENQISSVCIRSPWHCETEGGICQKCYGLDLSRPGETIALGTAVGIIAAQSLGEPGTQLTMRTFHTGGISSEEDITQGLPKVKQIFDNIKPDKEEKAILAKSEGIISSITAIDSNETNFSRLIKQKDQAGAEIIYPIEKERLVRVQPGEKVKKGQKLTGGKIDLEEYLEIVGREVCQNYIKEEIRKAYNNQGIEIAEKHIEIFACQMLSKVEVIAGGDSDYLGGDIVNYQQIQKNNNFLLSSKKKPIIFKDIIFSLKDLASHPPSFLAGISFQNTLKGLVDYSLYQPIDYLQGSKESLIAGQLIPVGTGFKERGKYTKGTTRSKSKEQTF
ncbi:6933_t:CDS:2 [Ambispora gerdemannii]|uniref:DNA-directed RNA polymerase n=1 Tax=Ambispora gerdemannii TaxID=144530 RepID=A0A9N9CQ52_9GLOM|nr:6933_t:CDS:2 [Ambispora gerdemannii]